MDGGSPNFWSAGGASCARAPSLGAGSSVRDELDDPLDSAAMVDSLDADMRSEYDGSASERRDHDDIDPMVRRRPHAQNDAPSAAAQRALRWKPVDGAPYAHYEPTPEERATMVRGMWVPLRTGVTSVVPCRSVVINVPVERLAPHASTFAEASGAEDTYEATVATMALLGLLSAGHQQGLISGNHAEIEQEQDARAQDPRAQRRAQAKSAVTSVERYVMRRPGATNATEVVPMFQWMSELIADEDGRTVAVRLWCHVFDETHSLTGLSATVMRESAALHQHGRLGAHCARARSVAHSAEQQRFERSGKGYDTIESNVEQTAFLQYMRIFDVDVKRTMMHLHGGAKGARAGRPYRSDASAHEGTQSTRLPYAADPDGYGGRSPWSWEVAFNPRYPGSQALSYGLACDGRPLRVHPAQLDPASYFDGFGRFCVPERAAGAGVDRSAPFLFVNGLERTRDSPFAWPLPVDLLGSVVPEDTLVRMFAEWELRRSRDGAPTRAQIDCVWERAVSEADTVALLNYAHGMDQECAQQRERVRADLIRHDMASAGAAGTSAARAGTGGAYVIETREMDAWAREATKRLSDVHSAWHAARKAELTERAGSSNDEDASWLQRTNARARRALLRLHIAWIERCFTSARALESMPPGYVAMHRSLVHEIEHNGGTASAAFPNAAGAASGMQTTASDLTTFGSMVAWATSFFGFTCGIEGRDRNRLMLMALLRSFDPYFEIPGVFVVTGPKGTGKSLMLGNFLKLLPEGTVTFSNGSSAKAGMNGNQTASNGTVVYSDEFNKRFIRDGDELEAIKTLVTHRQVSIDRTERVDGAGGVPAPVPGRGAHRTFTIRTSFRGTYFMCCNYGPLLRQGDEERTPTQEAALQRYVTVSAHAQSDTNATGATFDDHLRSPMGQQRLHQFRLFWSLTAFCLMVMYKSPFAPGRAWIERMHAHWDNTLERQRGYTKPAPRRLQLRSNDATALAVMTAVWETYFCKQTAVLTAHGRPVHGTTHGQAFELAHLAAPILEAVHTREQALFGYSLALEYNHASSSGVMTTMMALSEYVGLMGHPHDVMSRALPATSATIYTAPWGSWWRYAGTSPADGHELICEPNCAWYALLVERLRTELVRSRASIRASDGPIGHLYEFPDVAIDSHVHARAQVCVIEHAGSERRSHYFCNAAGGNTGWTGFTRLLEGAGTPFDRHGRLQDIVAHGQQLGADRCARMEMRACASACAASEGSQSMIEQLRHVYRASRADADSSDTERSLRMQEAWLSNLSVAPLAGCMYAQHSLLRWMCDMDVRLSEHTAGSKSEGLASPSVATFEFSSSCEGDSRRRVINPGWMLLARCTRGADTSLLRLASEVAKTPTAILMGINEQTVCDWLRILSYEECSTKVGVMPHASPQRKRECGMVYGSDQDPQQLSEADEWSPDRAVRLGNSDGVVSELDLRTTLSYRDALNRMVQAERLPALTPALSPRVIVVPPVRISADEIVVSTTYALEMWTQMVEAAHTLSQVPGVQNRQPLFPGGKRPPAMLSTGDEGPRTDRERDAERIDRLPLSQDLLHIAIAHELADTLYNSSMGAVSALAYRDRPQMMTRFLGMTPCGPSGAALRPLTFPFRCDRLPLQAPLLAPHATSSSAGAETAREEARVVLMREPLEDEVRAFAELNEGSLHMHGIEPNADLNDYTTWFAYCVGSQIASGAVSEDDEDYWRRLASQETMEATREVHATRAAELGLAERVPQTYGGVCDAERAWLQSRVALEEGAQRGADGLHPWKRRRVASVVARYTGRG
jgi:hypothetical protein